MWLEGIGEGKNRGGGGGGVCGSRSEMGSKNEHGNVEAMAWEVG